MRTTSVESVYGVVGRAAAAATVGACVAYAVGLMPAACALSALGGSAGISACASRVAMGVGDEYRQCSGRWQR